MNSKRSARSMTLALVALSLVSAASVQQGAFAQPLGMSITATAVEGSDTITVTGQTTSDRTDITFKVTSPNGIKVADLSQITPDDDGRFAIEFRVGPTWTEDGFYNIMASQSIHTNSMYTLSVDVEVVERKTMETSATQSNLETGIFDPSAVNVAKDAGIEIDANAEIGSTTIEITGHTDRTSQDVTLTVNAPKGNVVSVDQVSPALNGTFTSIITTGGPLWKQDGFYTVTAQQFDDSKYTASAQVEIGDGVVIPEFGAIAAMILAVAIVAIIAVSAKSRLSIMPRY